MAAGRRSKQRGVISLFKMAHHQQNCFFFGSLLALFSPRAFSRKLLQFWKALLPVWSETGWFFQCCFTYLLILFPFFSARPQGIPKKSEESLWLFWTFFLSTSFRSQNRKASFPDYKQTNKQNKTPNSTRSLISKTPVMSQTRSDVRYIL